MRAAVLILIGCLAGCTDFEKAAHQLSDQLGPAPRTGPAFGAILPPRPAAEAAAETAPETAAESAPAADAEVEAPASAPAVVAAAPPPLLPESPAKPAVEPPDGPARTSAAPSPVPGRPGVVPAAVRPPARPVREPRELVGLEAADLEARLGAPALKRWDAPAEIWQYRTQQCVLDLYLYGGKVAHVGLRPKSRATPRASCLVGLGGVSGG